MKTITLISALSALNAALALCAVAESRLSGYGFSSSGLYHVTTSGAGDVEVSTNLQTWTKLASVSQELTLEDLASRHPGWRFYRAAGGGGAASSNILGYVKAAIAPGKMAILGNPFTMPLRLDTPEGRRDVFGTTNPVIKISIYGTNGTAVAHTLDKATGTWSPPLRPIRVQEGFAVENVGASMVQVKMGGELRRGPLNMSVPAGSSLVVPPVPQMGSVADVLGIPGKDGVQIDYFNDETQKHETSTYDSLSNGWTPKPPEYKPGRAVMVKTPAAATWTKSLPTAR
jgi:hypothetical protein